MIPLEFSLDVTNHGQDFGGKRLTTANVHFVTTIAGSDGLLVLDATDVDVCVGRRVATPEEAARIPAITAGYDGNRWAAFADDELASLARWSDEAAEWTPEDRQTDTTPGDLHLLEGLMLELQRRREVAP